MTKLKTDTFKKYLKLINLVTEKGNQITESLYLDFETSHVYFQGGKYHARFPFEFEGEKHDNFYVESARLLTLIGRYEELEVRDFTFYSGKDKFKLPHFVDDVNPMDFKIEGEAVEIKAIITTLKDTLNYVSLEDSSGLKGIFIQGGSIAGFDKFKLIESKLGLDVDNYEIDYDVAKLIVGTSFNSVDLTQSENKVKLTLDGCQIILAKDTDLALPPLDDEGVVSSYNHDTFVDVSSEELIDIVELIADFAKDNVNYRAKISVIEGELFLINDEDDCVVEKGISIINYSKELEGKSYWLNSVDFKQALNSLRDKLTKEVKLQLCSDEENESAALNVTVDNAPNKHIVLVLLD